MATSASAPSSAANSVRATDRIPAPVPPSADLLALVRASFRGAPHPVIVFNENLRILTANPAAASMLQCTVGEATGRPLFANLKNLDPDHLNLLSELLRGERDSLEIDLDPGEVAVITGVTDPRAAGHLLLQPLDHPDKKLFAVHITETSERRATEAAYQRSLRLESLLSSISADFLDTRWESVNDDIRRAMGRLGRVLGLVRLQIRETSAATTTSNLIVEWAAPGFAESDPDTHSFSFPATKSGTATTPTTELVLPEVFHTVTPVSGSAPELGLSRALYDAAPDDSVLVAPVAIGRHQVGAVVAQREGMSRWSVDETHALSTFGNLVMQLRSRSIVEAASRQRLSVEDLVRRVATDLIDVTPEHARETIESALAQLGEFFDVRRVMRWRFEPDGTKITATEAWSGDAVEGIGLRPRELTVDRNPQLGEVIALFEPVGHLLDSEQLFADDPERLPEGSYLLVPLVTGGVTTGGLVFERQRGVAWHELEIRALETVAALVGQLDARVEAERYLSSSFTQAPVGILLTDDTNRVVATNPAFARFLGIEEDDLVGSGLSDYLRPGGSWLDRPTEGHQGEIPFYRPDHRTVWGRVNSVRIPAPEGVSDNVLSYVEDVTRARRNRERLEFQANHDELTSLANRRVLVDELTACVGVPSSPDDAAVLMIDLDRFKVVNDSLGHSVGDEILCTVAARIQTAVRETDLVSRLGGDEFVVLLRGPVGSLESVSVAQRIIELIKEPIRCGIHEVFVTGSVGIAFPSPDDRKVEDVLSHADAAMYDAKSKGRNRYETFDERSREMVASRIETESQLRRAIENDELEVYFQPEYDLVKNEIVGAESLVRWNHPDKGLLTAGAFIDIAEDTGLVVDIGSLVLKEACRQGAEWNARRDEPLTIRVNLSTRQLERASIVEEVCSVLAESGLPAERLCLEITETALMTDVEESMRLLTRLRDTGVRLAVDDFGTGFSSLAYLKKFPVDILKIDQAFIRNLDTDATDEAIVLSIIRLADALDLQVVAEGIEEDAHHTKLVEMGCERGQGFGLARPAPAHAIEELLGLRRIDAI